MEIELVYRVAGLLWRLRRVPVVESGIIRSLREEMERSDQPRDLSAAEIESLEEKLIRVRLRQTIQAEGGSVLSALKDGTYKARVETSLQEHKAKEEHIRLSPRTDQVSTPLSDGPSSG